MRNIVAINEVIDVLVDKARTLVPVPCTHPEQLRKSQAGKLPTSVLEHICLPC